MIQTVVFWKLGYISRYEVIAIQQIAAVKQLTALIQELIASPEGILILLSRVKISIGSNQ